MRVAVVGSGVSGLVAAALLRHEHDVTVLEASSRIGGHVNTVRVAGPSGPVDVDTGFIVFNEGNYPLFTALLRSLGVGSQPTEMSFSVRCEATGVEYASADLDRVFAQRRNLLSPAFHRMLIDILRFNREAPRAVANGAAELTLGEYVARAGYSPRLAEHYLVPMGSALWSVPRGTVMAMPVAFFVAFFQNHGMLQINGRPEWRVVEGGSRRYVDALVEPFRDRIHTSTAVHEVSRAAGHVRVNGERFDEVVLACHADDALRLLADPTVEEIEVLGALPYQSNEAVLHTDTSVLPRSTRAWAAWNYAVVGDEGAPVSVTYDMNRLQSLDTPDRYCVTLNPPATIDPATVLHRTNYRHPVYTTAGVRAQRRWAEVSGRRHTHYCGAYWGFGFHEDGVRSGAAVARALGVAVA